MSSRCMLNLIFLFGTISTTWSTGPGVCGDEVFSEKKIVEVMRRVREYQLAHPWKETDRDWIRGTYYTGVMGLYRITEDPEILAQARQWAQKHDWAEGGERHPANKNTCGQTYLELYFLDPDPRKIEKIQGYAFRIRTRQVAFSGTIFRKILRSCGVYYRWNKTAQPLTNAS